MKDDVNFVNHKAPRWVLRILIWAGLIAIVLTALIIGCLIVFGIAKYPEHVGTLAEWLGAIGTIGAVIVALYQINKNSKESTRSYYKMSQPQIKIDVNPARLDKTVVYPLNFNREYAWDSNRIVLSNLSDNPALLIKVIFKMDNDEKNNVYYGIDRLDYSKGNFELYYKRSLDDNEIYPNSIIIYLLTNRRERIKSVFDCNDNKTGYVYNERESVTDHRASNKQRYNLDKEYNYNTLEISDTL